MKSNLIIGSAIAAGLAFSADPGPQRGEEIKLWPNGAPGSEGITSSEVSKPSVAPQYGKLPGNFTVTHYPSIYVFLPPKEKATGAAMVVAPGGGHTQLVMEKEGWEVADWLNSHGIAAFVLKYRLARAPGVKYTLQNEVYADTARSVRLVRSRSKEWGLDPGRIGFIGFSAGGEVAGMIETRFDAGKPDAEDPVERVSSRPDFNVLIYPFYRPGSVPPRPAGGRGSGGPPAASAEPVNDPIRINPNETFPMRADAPPVFMVCADDDRSHVEPTVKFYLELEANHIPAEMHIYAYGEHGFGLRPTKRPDAPVESWPDRVKDWLADRNISKQ
jgi:acetyl esterase/lipase